MQPISLVTSRRHQSRRGVNLTTKLPVMLVVPVPARLPGRVRRLRARRRGVAVRRWLLAHDLRLGHGSSSRLRRRRRRRGGRLLLDLLVVRRSGRRGARGGLVGGRRGGRGRSSRSRRRRGDALRGGRARRRGDSGPADDGGAQRDGHGVEDLGGRVQRDAGVGRPAAADLAGGLDGVALALPRAAELVAGRGRCVVAVGGLVPAVLARLLYVSR
jgi:hypothetical protein